MKRFILLLVLIFSICSCNYNVNNDITTYVIKFKDGTEIRVGYPKENMAVWWIEIEKTGGAAYAMNRCDDENAEIYSDVFSINSEVAWHKVVRKGEKN